MHIDLLSLKPFEICSVRPPTENYSLTFRLTRNCYWKRCRFCPAYKFGARFSKRSIGDVKEDIRRAKLLEDFLLEQGISTTPYSYSGASRMAELAHRVKMAKQEAGCFEESPEEEIPKDLDPRLLWFLRWFKDKPNLEDSLNHVLSWRLGGGKTCFMGDADSLILKPDFMTEAINEMRYNFASIERFTVYGRTRTAARIRKLDELKAYHKAGLDRVHFGLESGSDTVLKFMEKGVTRNEHVEGGLKAKEAGLSCSVYVMPGLGGRRWSEEHAGDTAEVLTKIAPNYIRLRSLQVFPQTPLDEAIRHGEFTEADEEQVVKEIRIMVKEIDTETDIVSDSASNLLNINGSLPDDREAMLGEIDRYLAFSHRDKLLFSLESRLRAFAGQYGGLTSDISAALVPYMKSNAVDFSGIPNAEIENMIRMIRSKLMP